MAYVSLMNPSRGSGSPLRGSASNPSSFFNNAPGSPTHKQSPFYWSPSTSTTPATDYIGANYLHTSTTPRQHTPDLQSASPKNNPLSLSSLYYSTPRKQRPQQPMNAGSHYGNEESYREGEVSQYLTSPRQPGRTLSPTAARYPRRRVPSMIVDRTTSAMIPPQDPSFQNSYVIVLDLDETLVYAREGPIELRPGCAELLQALQELACEVLVWTAGERDYAQEVISRIDGISCIQHCVYRHEKWWTGRPGYCKDLRLLGRSMDHILMVDNTPDCLRVNPENALLVSDFMNQMSPRDEVLYGVIAFIRQIVQSRLPIPSALRRSDKVHLCKVQSEVYGTYDLYALTADHGVDGSLVVNMDLTSAAAENLRAAPRYSAWANAQSYLYPVHPQQQSHQQQQQQYSLSPPSHYDALLSPRNGGFGSTHTDSTHTWGSTNSPKTTSLHHLLTSSTHTARPHQTPTSRRAENAWYIADKGSQSTFPSNPTEASQRGSMTHRSYSCVEATPPKSTSGSFSPSAASRSFYDDVSPLMNTHHLANAHSFSSNALGNVNSYTAESMYTPRSATVSSSAVPPYHPFSTSMSSSIDWLKNAPSRSRGLTPTNSTQRGRAPVMARDIEVTRSQTPRHPSTAIRDNSSGTSLSSFNTTPNRHRAVSTLHALNDVTYSRDSVIGTGVRFGSGSSYDKKYAL